MMSVLFSKAKIGSLDLANRLIRTASHEGLADSRGRPTEDQFAFYKGFIKGGIGLVITGYAGISQTGKSALYHMTMIDSDDLIPAHRKLVEKSYCRSPIAAAKVKGKIPLPIITVGGMRSKILIENAIKSNQTDFVSIEKCGAGS